MNKKNSEKALGKKLGHTYCYIRNDVISFCSTLVEYASLFDPNDWHACVQSLKNHIPGISNDEIMAAYFIGKKKLHPDMYGKKADVVKFIVKNVTIEQQDDFIENGIRIAFEGRPSDEDTWIRGRDFHDLKNCWIDRWWNSMRNRPYTDAELIEIHASKWPNSKTVKKGRTVEDSLGNKILLKTKTVKGTKMIYLNGWYSAEKLENITERIH